MTGVSLSMALAAAPDHPLVGELLAECLPDNDRKHVMRQRDNRIQRARFAELGGQPPPVLHEGQRRP